MTSPPTMLSFCAVNTQSSHFYITGLFLSLTVRLWKLAILTWSQSGIKFWPWDNTVIFLGENEAPWEILLSLLTLKLPEVQKFQLTFLQGPPSFLTIMDSQRESTAQITIIFQPDSTVIAYSCKHSYCVHMYGDEFSYQGYWIITVCY